MSFLRQEQVCLLLGVWGERYIEDFLQLSLSSLLAPGNLPALAGTYHTTFIFLTRSHDIQRFNQHPNFQRLQSICQIEFIPIDDIIGISNYATTLTLAYDRAIRSKGEAMLNTYFLFLTSDYLFADGSMQGLMRYIAKGYSGIYAGNFQVVQEDMLPYIERERASDSRTIAIPPRKLVAACLNHLHPMTTTSCIDQSLVHNYRANRFFIRHRQALAGRFYLLHMLCIKPETTQYRVGGFCDYAFMPEMCPSGNIGVITDSDDYFVVELQPRTHELHHIHANPYDMGTLTTALAEWTTQQHRDNARHTIYFHAEELKQHDLENIEARLNAFIQPLNLRLQAYPAKPYYHHPYWIYRAKPPRAISHHDYDYVDLTTATTSTIKKWFQRIVGRAPAVFRWHHRFREYRMIRERIENHLATHSPSMTLTLYSAYHPTFMHYFHWQKRRFKTAHHYHLPNLLASPEKIAELGSIGFERLLFFCHVNELSQLKSALIKLQPVLRTSTKLLVVVPNELNHLPTTMHDITKSCSIELNSLVDFPFQIDAMVTVRDNLSFAGSLIIHLINQRFDYSKKWKFLSYFLVGIPASLLCLIRHSLPWIRQPTKGHCAHVLISLSPLLQTGNSP